MELFSSIIGFVLVFLLIFLNTLPIGKRLQRKIHRRMSKGFVVFARCLFYATLLAATFFYAGQFLNFVVIEANNGRMPVVEQESGEPFFLDPEDFKRNFYACERHENENCKPARLVWLADRHIVNLMFLNRYDVPKPVDLLLSLFEASKSEGGFYLMYAYSIGDIFIYISIVMFVFIALSIVCFVLFRLSTLPLH